MRRPNNGLQTEDLHSGCAMYVAGRVGTALPASSCWASCSRQHVGNVVRTLPSCNGVCRRIRRCKKMSLIVQVGLMTAQLIGSYAYELQCLLVIVHLSILHFWHGMGHCHPCIIHCRGMGRGNDGALLLVTSFHAWSGCWVYTAMR